jgi:O-antigen/teichoic acid export membrane protein
MGSVVEVLPTADGKAQWQAVAKTTMALARAAALGLAAVLTNDPAVVLLAMCVVACCQAMLLPIYAFGYATTPGLGFRGSLLVEQFRYSALFAIGNAFYHLRIRVDQWIVASYFAPSVFALISIAAVVLSVSTLVRKPLNDATLPKLSMLVGEGRFREATELQGRAFTSLALFLLPVIGLLLVVTNEVVELIYTPAYLGAVPLMQIYLLGQVTGVFAAGHLLLILNAGRLATRISVVCLLISVCLSLLGVKWIGLQGAVAGSVASLIVGELWALNAVKKVFGATYANLLNWRITIRAFLNVAFAVILCEFVRRQVLLGMPVELRLFVVSGMFLLTIVTGVLALGLKRELLSVLGNLSRAARR